MGNFADVALSQGKMPYLCSSQVELPFWFHLPWAGALPSGERGKILQCEEEEAEEDQSGGPQMMVLKHRYLKPNNPH